MLPAVVLVVIVALAAFGRLVPGVDPAGRDGAWAGPPDRQATDRPAPSTGPRLLAPVAGVLWIRAAEIDARGFVDAGVGAVEALVVANGTVLGKATFEVDASGQFDGVVGITPPVERTAVRLEIREPGRGGPALAAVAFLVEAGSAVLIRDESSLGARIGETLIVDVLVYQSLHQIRALVTGPGGTLIAEATGSAALRDLLPNAAPATLMLRLAVPANVRPTRARLHVVALDRPGHEVAHTDANLPITAGE